MRKQTENICLDICKPVFIPWRLTTHSNRWNFHFLRNALLLFTRPLPCFFFGASLKLRDVSNIPMPIWVEWPEILCALQVLWLVWNGCFTAILWMLQDRNIGTSVVCDFLITTKMYHRRLSFAQKHIHIKWKAVKAKPPHLLHMKYCQCAHATPRHSKWPGQDSQGGGFQWPRVCISYGATTSHG